MLYNICPRKWEDKHRDGKLYNYNWITPYVSNILNEKCNISWHFCNLLWNSDWTSNTRLGLMRNTISFNMIKLVHIVCSDIDNQMTSRWVGQYKWIIRKINSQLVRKKKKGKRIIPIQVDSFHGNFQQLFPSGQLFSGFAFQTPKPLLFRVDLFPVPEW